MQQRISEEKMGKLKVMDFNAPPTEDLGYLAFPKMVYLHPKDKTKAHKSRIVANEDELKAALAQGYRVKPHVPEVPESAMEEFESDIPEKRGPGRPPREQAS